MRRALPVPLVLGIVVVGLSACGSGSAKMAAHRAPSGPTIPPLLNPDNVYAADYPGNFSPAARSDPALVYVPNSLGNTVDVINQNTLKIVRHVPG